MALGADPVPLTPTYYPSSGVAAAYLTQWRGACRSYHRGSSGRFGAFRIPDDFSDWETEVHSHLEWGSSAPAPTTEGITH